MALIKLSAIGITNLSGKAGGSVFAHNKGGKYVRNFAVPTNPSTAPQEDVRATFGGFSQAWRGLTQAQRDAWYAAADDYGRTNRFGDATKLSGNSLYISLNQNIANVSGTALIVPKSPAGTNVPKAMTGAQLGVGAVSGQLEVASVKLDWVENLAAPNQLIVLEATASASPGVRNLANRYRKIAVITPGATGDPLDFKTTYPEVFGVPAVGSKVGLRAKFVNLDTGEVSTYVSAETIVTSIP